MSNPSKINRPKDPKRKWGGNGRLWLLELPWHLY